MKETCTCELKKYLSECFSEARIASRMTQETFAASLLLSTRAYISIEHGSSLCCTLVFILYLAFVCEDIDALRDDLRRVLLEAAESKGYVPRHTTHDNRPCKAKREE